MKYLGLDLGTKTCGVAVSLNNTLFVTPQEVIKYKNYEDLVINIMEIVSKYKIDEIILGYPKNMDNTKGKRAYETELFKEYLESKIDKKIILVDERMSTISAENILIESDMSRKKRKDKIDSLSACFILEMYLKMKGNSNE